ncbi:MAG TPA: GtrA family protein [Anaerolineales bacterium]|nr:GtrA family protein [Anaerolineales bacterium]
MNESKERSRFLKFAAVGALGSMIDFGVMNLLTRAFSMRLVFAGTISFICAVINNFTGNRYWTYPESRSRHILHQLGMFFIVNAAGIAIRVPILHFVEPPMETIVRSTEVLSSFSPETIAKNATLALAIALVMLWNFFVNRYWTYNDVE